MTYPIPSARIFSTETQTNNGQLKNKASAVVNLNISRDVPEETKAEYPDKEDPYEGITVVRSSDETIPTKKEIFYEAVLDAYMNNPIFSNQYVVMKTEKLVNLVKALTDADEVEITNLIDIGCCGRPTKYNRVDSIVVIKNNSRVDFKVSYNEWYRMLQDYRVSLKFTQD